MCFFTQSVDIVADNLDDLVIQGIEHIKDKGELFSARAGSGQQAYDVNYILTDPRNRVHTLRNPVASRYFARELLAYFRGSLKVEDGLAQASNVWKLLADNDGNIASNYGHYVFHQKPSEESSMTQYDWVIKNLTKNIDSRKAFININQPKHKKFDTKDFPCTLGIQYFVVKNHLCSTVSSRSTDIYTGLPYDMGFFSFVHELVYQDLKERLEPETANCLKMGPVKMKTNFTQIYDKSRTSALRLLSTAKENPSTYVCDMPPIYDAQETLKDIYNQTSHTPVIKWIYKHAEL